MSKSHKTGIKSGTGNSLMNKLMPIKPSKKILNTGKQRSKIKETSFPTRLTNNETIRGMMTPSVDKGVWK